jgi:hypothetical protein
MRTSLLYSNAEAEVQRLEVAFRKTRKLARKEKSKLTMEVPE